MCAIDRYVVIHTSIYVAQIAKLALYMYFQNLFLSGKWITPLQWSDQKLPPPCWSDKDHFEALRIYRKIHLHSSDLFLCDSVTFHLPYRDKGQ